jgi:hypothetical protein
MNTLRMIIAVMLLPVALTLTANKVYGQGIKGMSSTIVVTKTGQLSMSEWTALKEGNIPVCVYVSQSKGGKFFNPAFDNHPLLARTQKEKEKFCSVTATSEYRQRAKALGIKMIVLRLSNLPAKVQREYYGSK